MPNPITYTGEKKCDVCNTYVTNVDHHDKDVHLIAALERIASVLEGFELQVNDSDTTT